MTTQAQALQGAAAVVLAAGKGTRMKADLPKVVMPLAGKSMVSHVVENLIAAGIKRIILVVGYKKEEVIKLFRDSDSVPGGVQIDFVEQTEQLGTGHAVLVTESALGGHQGPILVTNGDMPMIRPGTFRSLLQTHLENGNGATVLSSILEEPFGYGRLVRDARGELERIVEEKDADDAIRALREVNSGTYVFNAPEVFEALRRIGTDNKQGEYYLPDMIVILRKAGRPVGSLALDDPAEALGANSREDLAQLEETFKARAS